MAWTAFTHEGTDYYGPECFMSPKNLRQWSSTDYVTDYMGNIRLTWYHNRDRDRLELTKVRISDIDYVVRSPVEEKSDEVDDKPTTPLSLLANRFVGTEIKSLLRLEALFMVATNPGKNLLEITGERQRSNRRYQKVYSRIKPLINELGLIVETRDDADIPSYHLTEIGRSAVESIDGDPEALHKALKLLLHYDIRYDHVFADLAVVLDGNEVFGDRIAELKAYKLANEKGLTGFKRNARGRYAVQLTTMGKMLRDALYNVLDLKKGE